MNVIVAVSGYIIPAVMLFIVIHGYRKKYRFCRRGGN